MNGIPRDSNSHLDADESAHQQSSTRAGGTPTELPAVDKHSATSDSATSGSESAQHLIAKLLSDRLSFEEQQQLSRVLTADSALREQYRKQLLIHAFIQWRFGRALNPWGGRVDPVAIAELLSEMEQAQRQMEAELAAERAASEAEELARQRELDCATPVQRRPQPIVIPYSVVYVAAASLIAAAVWLFVTFGSQLDRAVALPESTGSVPAESGSAQSEAVPTPRPVAVLSDSVLAKFFPVPAIAEVDGMPQGSPPLTAGAPLYANIYELAQGVVRLKMAGGADLLLEAPSHVDLRSPDRVRLVQGRLVGEVPPTAIGFAVEAPTATVVDLGTEFGVSVPAEDAVDVTLFDGELEVVASGLSPAASDETSSSRRRLSQNGALRVNDQADFVQAQTRSSLYFRELPTPLELGEKKAYERWVQFSDQLSHDSHLLAYYTFHDEPQGSQILQNVAGDDATFSGQIHGAQWTLGRWRQKRALRFASSDPNEQTLNHVALDIPGQFDQLTLTAWVNFDFLLGNLTSLFMTTTYDDTRGLHWQLTNNGYLHIGLSRAVETQIFESTEPLSLNATGKWHHLATVIDLQSSSVSFFMNGKAVGTLNVDHPYDLTLGEVWLGNWAPEDRDFRNHKPLHGKMDELAVFRRALPVDEIKSIYAAGKVRL